MYRLRTNLLILLLIAAIQACSSKKAADDDFGDGAADEIPVADAGTDAIPADGLESPGEDIPPADGGDPFAEEAPAAAAEAPPGGDDPFQSQPDAVAAAPSGGFEPPSAGSGQVGDYSVKRGDTLMKIAFETYGNVYMWKKIYELNQDKITDPNNVPRGTILKVEAPATPTTIERNGEAYRIQHGDTLGTISNAVYGTPSRWREIYNNNRQLVRDPNKIYAGFYVYYVPSGGAPLADQTPSAPSLEGGEENRLPAADADAGLGN